MAYIRYLIRQLTGPMFFVTLALTGVAWLTQSLRLIDHIVNQGLSIGMFLSMTMLIMPSLLSVVLPIALFSAVLYTYNRLALDSELIVLENAGLSKMALARPVIIVGMVTVVISYSISLYLLPASYREFKDLQSFIRDNFASVLLQEGVFNTPMKGMTIYIREKQQNGTFKGILVHDNRNTAKPVTRMAEQGQLVQTPSGPRVILVNGNHQEVDHESGTLSIIHFDRYNLDLSVFTQEQEKRWREPKERYLHELFYPEPDSPERLNAKLRAEGHQRLVWPLYNLVLPLLGLAVLSSGQFNRRGNYRRLALAIALAVVVTGGAISMQNIVTEQPILIPVMYLLVVVITALSVFRLTHVTHKPISPVMPENV